MRVNVCNEREIEEILIFSADEKWLIVYIYI